MASEQIPKTVKQWNIEKFGGFDGLKFSEQALPELGDGEVLVKRMWWSSSISISIEERRENESL